MNEAPDPISYADFLTRWGITLDRSDSHLRIVIPPTGGFGALPQGLKLGIGFVGACAVLFVVIRTYEREIMTPEAIEQLCSYAMILAVLMYFAYRRMRHSVMLEVTSQSFRISRVWREKAKTLKWWPRSKVARVVAVPDEGALLIYLTHLPMVELRLFTSGQVTQWLAEQITGALHELRDEPTRESTAASPASRHRVVMLRVMMQTLTIVLVLVGVGMLALDRTPWSGLGILSLLSALFTGLAAAQLSREM